MIKSICMKNVATYSPNEVAKIDNCSRVNFIYGANGSGKSTISNYLQDVSSSKYSSCSIEWYEESRPEIIVYNKDFRYNNFKGDIAGIFTLGKATIDEKQAIETLKKEKAKKLEHRTALKNTLDEKILEKSNHDSHFKETVWKTILKENEQDFSLIFSGFRGSKEKFCQEVLSRYKTCHDSSETRENLISRTQSLLSNKPEPCPTIICDSNALVPKIIEIEEDGIWEKAIVGNKDIPISKLIEFLQNSDWVNSGRKYLNNETALCPFCQKETITDDFRDQLNAFFDGEYDDCIQRISSCVSTYKTITQQLCDELRKITNDTKNCTIGQINVALFNSLLSEINSLFSSNIANMQLKSREASNKIEIKQSSEQLQKIIEIIRKANEAISVHNSIVQNYRIEKDNLIDDVWSFLLDTNESLISSYLYDLKCFDKACESLTSSITADDDSIRRLESEIVEKNRNITSVQPTIDEINRSLKAYGFTNFKITNSVGDEHSYQIQRMDGTLASDTLSEGEETFVTFLYFLQLAKGAIDESKVSSKRILVIDDPICSLDSTVLYIVSSMVKSILADVRQSKTDVEQVFILTHNVFFHKEASFIDGRTMECSDYHYWIINKDNNVSRIIPYGRNNPIKTSYELLWKELKDNTAASLVTTQNIMRRILENYFGILGKKRDETIIQSFSSVEDRLICRSLISWINDGSHIIPDDLYIDSYTDSIDRYKSVFKDIFINMGHEEHYNMMMGIE